MKDLILAKKYISKSQNAASRGIAFTLTYRGFCNMMKAKRCYYTGVELNDIDGDPNQRSIDRVDSSKPYETGNVVACSRAFNQLKGSLERDGMLKSKKFRNALSKMFNTLDKKST